jgi:DNA-binding CsgD family transcriptional regulator
VGTTAAVDKVDRLARRATDAIGLLRDVASVLEDHIRFDLWCGLLLDPATLVNTGGYHEAFPARYMPRLVEIEYGEEDVNSFPHLARLPAGVCTLERATDGDLARSTRFRDVLTPSGYGSEVRAVIRDRHTGVWGGFAFYRSVGHVDFSEADCDLLATACKQVAPGLRRTMLVTEAAHRDLPDGPGMAVLELAAGHLGVEMASAAARRWLADINDGHLAPSDLPVVVATLAQQAARDPAGSVNARVRSRSGQWITLHVETIPTDHPRSPRRLSLVVEPTRPHELAEVIAAVYGLTPRERQVARYVVAGYANREIATALYVSPHTVGDHLKAIYAKLGVRSRAELTSRLFFDQYLPRMTSGTPIGGDGWYITPAD